MWPSMSSAWMSPTPTICWFRPALRGFVFSVIALLLVLTATPAPSYLGGIAAERARLIEERLPAAIKSLRSR